MDLAQLILLRHNVLYEYWLDHLWQTVPQDLMRQRPHPRVNSIAWNIWHLTRVEDAGLNRFVVDRPQVLDESSWMERMRLPWRHHGSGMSFAEVDELDQRIDLEGLRGYSGAVRLRTQEIIAQIDPADLDAVLTPERARQIVIEEGLAHSDAEELAAHYTGWSKGRCFMTYGLTHSFEHIGEISVIVSLLDVDLG